MSQDPADCRIEYSPGARACEYVSYAWPPAGAVPSEWPLAPGAIRLGADGRPELLHFAPGRWLAPGAAPDSFHGSYEGATPPAGTLVDVSGKWDGVQLRGGGAARLLATTIDLERVLEQRDCAAVTLFDSPAIIVRVPDGYLLWVQSSYTSDFLTAAKRARAVLEARR